MGVGSGMTVREVDHEHPMGGGSFHWTSNILNVVIEPSVSVEHRVSMCTYLKILYPSH